MRHTSLVGGGGPRPDREVSEMHMPNKVNGWKDLRTALLIGGPFLVVTIIQALTS